MDPEYKPGEPYEFEYKRWYYKKPQMHYRCFRGRCTGNLVWVADRNTHNAVHNEWESRGL